MNHPPVARLAAFGHGKLGEARAEAIAAHLAECAACREYLDNLADDALLALIRSLFVPDPCPASSAPEAALERGRSPGRTHHVKPDDKGVAFL